MPLRMGQIIKIEARERLMREWEYWLGNPALKGQRIREAIIPKLKEWVEGGRGHLTYRTTQVLTGHSCFGQYLCRIGRDEESACNHCADPMDSAQHTLAEYEAWAEDKRILTNVVGLDLEMPTLIGRIIDSQEAWSALMKFCEAVMLKKEDAEKARRGEVPRAELQDGAATQGRRGGGRPGVGRRPRRRRAVAHERG